MDISIRRFSKSIVFTSLIFATSTSIAATLTVTSLSDSGAGSLRQAISDAVAGDRIIFGITGTIFVGSQMHITKSLSISGPTTGKLYLNGSSASRVFHIHGSNDVSIRNITIEDADPSISGLTELGGAMYNSSRLMLANVTLKNNSAQKGAGIYNIGNLTMMNTTISGNTAVDANGGCVDAGQGGGVYNGGAASMFNSTVTGNYAECGAAIYQDAGGISAVNSIISADSAQTLGACYNLTSPVVVRSRGSNINSDNSCGLARATDMVNTDPLLGPLQNNGGSVDTHSPLDGSPAIDAGSDSFAPRTDATGTQRPQGMASDIGAVEVIRTDIPVAR